MDTEFQRLVEATARMKENAETIDFSEIRPKFSTDATSRSDAPTAPNMTECSLAVAEYMNRVVQTIHTDLRVVVSQCCDETPKE